MKLIDFVGRPNNMESIDLMIVDSRPREVVAFVMLTR